MAQILNNKCDILKDKTIINWFENEEGNFETSEGLTIIPKDINQKNKKKMEKFVNELKNTDEEEEEEDDDDDEN